MLPGKVRMSRYVGNLFFITFPLDLECAAVMASDPLEQAQSICTACLLSRSDQHLSTFDFSQSSQTETQVS